MAETRGARGPTVMRVAADPRVSVPGWVAAVAVIGALLMAIGAIIALVNPGMLVSPNDLINGAVRIYAGYLTARNLTIAVMLLAALLLRATGMLNSLMLLTGFIQLVDAIVDCYEGRWIVAPGVVVIGALFLLASARVSGAPFWNVRAWRAGD